MDLGIIEAIINGIGLEFANASEALVPIGNAVAFSLSVLAVVWLGAAALSGTLSTMLPGILSLCAGCAATFWLLQVWPGLPQMLVHDARTMIGMVTGGYAGPSQLFELAAMTYGRFTAETLGWGWSVTSVAQSLGLAIIAPFVLFGLAYTGLLAVLAELSLLIGGAVAPVVICMIALPFTRSIGIGALHWCFGQMVRCVILGVTATVMARVVSNAVTLHGIEAGYTTEEIVALALVSFLTFLVGHSANSIAGALVGGSTLGMSAFTASTTAATSIGSSVGGAAVSAGKVAGGAASKVRSAGEAARTMAPVTAASGNSAFGS